METKTLEAAKTIAIMASSMIGSGPCTDKDMKIAINNATHLWVLTREEFTKYRKETESSEGTK